MEEIFSGHSGTLSTIASILIPFVLGFAIHRFYCNAKKLAKTKKKQSD